MKRKPHGLTIIELVETLDAHGFKNLADLEKMPPNPLQWNRNQWHFARSVIAKALGISEAEVSKQFTRAGDFLRVFNETLRKTGLVIELQQIRKVAEAAHLTKLNKDGKQWDTEWVDQELENERAHKQR